MWWLLCPWSIISCSVMTWCYWPDRNNADIGCGGCQWVTWHWYGRRRLTCITWPVLHCTVMQPLTADRAVPLISRQPPLGLRTAFVQNSQFANILPAKGRQPPPEPGHCEGVSQDIFAAVDTREDIVPQKLYQKTWQLWFFFTFGFMKN